MKEYIARLDVIIQELLDLTGQIYDDSSDDVILSLFCDSCDACYKNLRVLKALLLNYQNLDTVVDQQKKVIDELIKNVF